MRHLSPAVMAFTEMDVVRACAVAKYFKSVYVTEFASLQAAIREGLFQDPTSHVTCAEDH